MWAIENSTDFVVDGVGITDRDGRNAWVVVVKATFLFDDTGVLVPAPKEKQVEFSLLPQYRGEDGQSSLLYEADSCPAKPGTDVVLNADAWAPGGNPTSRMNVSLRIGDRIKTLVVSGRREYQRQLSGLLEPSPPLPFVQQPIEYEGAHGGHDTSNPDPTKQRYHASNPVGAGIVRGAGERAPNIEHAGNGRHPNPAGFGAIASFWHPRTTLHGTYDAAWFKDRKPLLPADFDPRHYHCAPVDQQFEAPLRGGEAIGLENLTPDGRRVFRLPKHYFGFTTIARGEAIEHRGKLDTVIIEPSKGRVIMSWKSQLDCHKDFDYIDFTRVAEKEYVESA